MFMCVNHSHLCTQSVDLHVYKSIRAFCQEILPSSVPPVAPSLLIRPVPVHLCWKVQRYIEELQQEEWSTSWCEDQRHGTCELDAARKHIATSVMHITRRWSLRLRSQGNAVPFTDGHCNIGHSKLVVCFMFHPGMTLKPPVRLLALQWTKQACLRKACAIAFCT